MSGARIAIVALLAALGAGACKKAAPEVAPAAAPPPSVEILKDGRWLFTYVETDGKFATTDKADVVPDVARRAVRVVDPSQSADRRLDTAQVNVIDLAALMKDGKVRARAVPREVFESVALAQLPPGRSSLRSGPRAAPPTDPEEPAAGSAAPGGKPQAAGGPPQVTIYGTSWCAACRAARKWFGEHGVPFADKDVEQDEAAARELGAKAATAGIPTDRVPILDVKGRLLVGFDPARVQALLGSP